MILQRYTGKNLAIAPAFVMDRDNCGRSKSPELFSAAEYPNYILNLAKQGIDSPQIRYPDFHFYECAIRNPLSLSFDPEGYLYKCWEHIGNTKYSIGQINKKGVIENVDWTLLNRQMYGADPLEDPNCRKCPYLPICCGGCPIQRIENKFENGKQEPSIVILQNMAQILNVTIDYLINGNIVIDEKKARDLKLIPQIKFNKIIYDIDLPHCQLDYGKLALDYYDWQNDDEEEEVFLKHLTDFSGAYHLDTSVINPTAEVKEKIRNLYYAAFDHGNGLIEAGLNLIRFYIVQDILGGRS